MSNSELDHPALVERWFPVMLASIVPALAAFALPDSLRVVFFAGALILFAAGCVMLYRQETRRS